MLTPSFLLPFLLATLPSPVDPGTSDISIPANPDPFASFEDDPIQLKQIVLDNGLTVMLSENHERPEVFGAIVVKTGGKRDPEDNTGMAHYLEHMLFKGTTQLGTTDWTQEQPLQTELEELYERLRAAPDDAARKKIQEKIGATLKKTYAHVVPNEFGALISEMGGKGLNAFTTQDETVYFNRFPASQIEAWLELYAHRFTHPVFRLFPTELEAVYEELNRAVDSSFYPMYRWAHRRIFPGHPYSRQDVIGEIEHLRRPSLRTLRAYFDRHYVANNMALVLSGDFDANEIRPIIEAKFGGWRRGPEVGPIRTPVRSFRGRELHTARLTPVRAGVVCFRTVPPSHPDFAALSVASQLLSNEQGSGYLDVLSNDGKLLEVFLDPIGYADHGAFAVSFSPKIVFQGFRQAEALILGEIDRLKRGDFGTKRLVAARQALIHDEEEQWEDNEGRGLAVADAFVRQPSWQHYLDYRRRLQQIDRDDVMQVAQRYFGRNRLVLQSRMGFPKGERVTKPGYPPLEPRPGVHSAYYREFQARPEPRPTISVVDFDNDIETLDVAPGITLRTNPNPFNNLYSLEIRYGVGSDAIRELPIVADYLDRVGSTRQPAEAFRSQLELLNSTVSFYSTDDRFVVRIEGPEDRMAAALDLIGELLQEPEHDRSRLRKIRFETWFMYRILRREPEFVADALAEYAFFGANSGYLREIGPQGLRRVSVRDLLAAWERVKGREVEVRYTGRQAPEKVRDLVQDHVRFAHDPKPAVDPVVYPRVLGAKPRVYFLPYRGAVQSKIYFGIEGEPVPASQRGASEAFNAYFGDGMDALVFQEIREFRALAYEVGAWLVPDLTPVQDTYLLAFVGCQADKTQEAIKVMMGLLRDMPEKKGRLAALRSTLLRGQEAESPGFRNLQHQVETWRRLGYGRDPRPALAAQYTALTFEDVASVYREQVKGRPVTMAIVADPRVVDLDELKKWGELVRVRKGQIFAP